VGADPVGDRWTSDADSPGPADPGCQPLPLHNLTISNMDWRDFAGNVDDGIFRGFE
jgi:hypothetical protein